jgi:hypothetical protein
MHGFEAGKWYCVCLPMGWVWVGRFVEQAGPAHGLFADAAFVTRAGHDWGQFMSAGPGENARFNLCGTVRLNVLQSLWDGEYTHARPWVRS